MLVKVSECAEQPDLLVDDAFVFQPAVGMSALGVVVRPVNYPAFFRPFVFAVKSHRVAFFQPFDFRGEVDVVGNQQALPAIQFQNKPLVSGAAVVVGQRFTHDTAAFYLDIALAAFKGRLKNRFGGRFAGRMLRYR